MTLSIHSPDELLDISLNPGMEFTPPLKRRLANSPRFYLDYLVPAAVAGRFRGVRDVTEVPPPDWAALYQQHRDAMYRVAARTLRSAGREAEAGDVVMAAMESLMKKPPEM